jgi:tetratricopeptide (TPR) repeat protein
MYKKITFCLTLISFFANAQDFITLEFQTKKESIDSFKTSCEKINYFYQMQDYQSCIDNILKKDSTVAYLWQRKAMPYFKARKYQIGMKYLDKAVFYDKSNWLPYRAFIKTIFSKEYDKAIIDLDECIKSYSNGYVMDHTYTFYKSLCYLQMNEFEQAKNQMEIAITKNKTQNVEHHIEYFYMGVINYELNNYDESLEYFNKAINIYKEFSDAIAYKTTLEYLLRKISYESYIIEHNKAKEFHKNGHKFNESNTVHELYPYQIKF